MINNVYSVDSETGECTELPSITPYDDLTDKECDELAQESYDNLVHSCIEAGGEIRELRRLLTIAKDDLLYLLLDGEGYREQLNSQGLFALSVLMNEYGMSKEKVDKDFKEISEYLGGLENE